MRKRFEELYEALYRAEAALSKVTQELRILYGAKSDLDVENAWMTTELTFKNRILSQLEEMLKERDDQIAALKEELEVLPTGIEQDDSIPCGHGPELERLEGQKEALDKLLQDKNTEILNLQYALDKEKKEVKIKECSHGPELENLRDEINKLMIQQANKDSETLQLNNLPKQPGGLPTNVVISGETVKDCNHLPQIRELQGKVEILEGDLSLKEFEIERLKEEIERFKKELPKDYSDLHLEIGKLRDGLNRTGGDTNVLRDIVIMRDEEIRCLRTEFELQKKELQSQIQPEIQIQEETVEEAKDRDVIPDNRHVQGQVELLEVDVTLKGVEVEREKEDLHSHIDVNLILGEKDQHIEDLQKYNEQLIVVVNRKEHEIRSLEEELDRIKHIFTKENHDLHGEIGQLRESLTKSRDEGDRLSGFVQEKVVEIVKECNHIPQIRDLQGKVEVLEGNAYVKEREIEKLNEELHKLRKELETQPQKSPHINVDLGLGEKDKHIEELKRDNQRLHDDLNRKEEQVRGLKEELERLKSDLSKESSQSQGEVGKLRENLNKLQGVADDFSGLMSKKDEEIAGLKAELEKHKQEHQSHVQPEVQIQEKVVEIVKECNHIPKLRDLQGKVEILEGDVYVKGAEIEKLNGELEKLIFSQQ